MNIFNDLCSHLSDMNVDWHLCGGFAIDSYLGYITRSHKDIDITVSFNDMKTCIQYLKSKGWEIDAPVGNQRFVPVEFALEHQDLYFDNIWCYKKNADFIKTEKVDGVFKYLKFINREQTELDFIEVLFNKVENGVFYYQKNHDIMMKVVIEDRNVCNIPILDVYNLNKKEKSPIVIMLHGGNGYKEKYLERAYKFVKEGFFVTLFDAYGYGELKKENETLDVTTINKTAIDNSLKVYFKISQYINTIINSYNDNPYADSNRVGLLGVSMGAHTIYYHILKEKNPNVKAVGHTVTPQMLDVACEWFKKYL